MHILAVHTCLCYLRGNTKNSCSLESWKLRFGATLTALAAACSPAPFCFLILFELTTCSQQVLIFPSRLWFSNKYLVFDIWLHFVVLLLVCLQSARTSLHSLKTQTRLPASTNPASTPPSVPIRMKQEKMPPATKKRPFMATQPATSITPPNLRAAPNRSIAIKSAPPASFPGSKPPSSLSTSSQQLQMPNNMLRPPTNNRMPVPGGAANLASDMMKMQHALFLQMQQRRYAAQRNGNAVNVAGRPSSSATMLSSNRTPTKPYARTPPAQRSVSAINPSSTSTSSSGSSTLSGR